MVALPQRSAEQEPQQEAGLERSPEELQQDRLAGILQARCTSCTAAGICV